MTVVSANAEKEMDADDPAIQHALLCNLVEGKKPFVATLRRWRIPGPDRQARPHPTGAGRVELAWRIRHEHDRLRCEAEALGDARITGGLAFRSSGRVEVRGEIRRQIASRGVLEKQLLGVRRAR